MFFIGLTILSGLTNASSLSCISMNNQQYQGRPEIINVNSNNPVIIPYFSMSRTNETRHIKLHETSNDICRLDVIVCNKKQRWNKNTCRCECKELIDKGVCYKGFIWNPSNCEWECDKSCDFGENLDYENFKFRKNLIEKLID